jgi:hypothetical protein
MLRRYVLNAGSADALLIEFQAAKQAGDLVQ